MKNFDMIKSGGFSCESFIADPTAKRLDLSGDRVGHLVGWSRSQANGQNENLENSLIDHSLISFEVQDPKNEEILGVKEKCKQSDAIVNNSTDR